MRILVYTDGEVIGDGIIRLPFAAALKQSEPSLHLTWLASGHSVYADVLAEMAQPIIDQLIVLPRSKPAFSDYLLRPDCVRGQSFDLILDTQRNVKRSLWLMRIRHRRFVSAAANGLLSSVPLAKSLSPHFLTRLVELGEAGTGRPLALNRLSLPSDHWREQAVALLPDSGRYVGFIVGAGHPDKCWPLDRFIALAQAVIARGEVPVMFLGPNERALHAQLQTALPQAVFPLAEGNASPYLTMALGGRLRVAVANDSGGGHLLAAGGAPLVSLFRADSVRRKFLPCGERVVALAQIGRAFV